MKVAQISATVLMLLTIIGSSGILQAQQTSAAPQQVDIWATASVVPLIKGLSWQKYARVRVAVPPGKKKLNVRQLELHWDQVALQMLDSVQLYYTGDEPNSDSGRILTQTRVSNSMLPTAIELGEGLHYFWIKVSLKESVDLDKKLALQAVHVRDTDGKSIPATLAGNGFEKRMAVAVRKAGQDHVHTYRIPGITTTNKGTLIAVYDNRYKNSRDLPGNIDVGMSRSTDGGITWEPMRVIMDMGEPQDSSGVGDPSILFDPVNNTIWVAALWSKGNRSIAGSLPGLSADSTGQLMLVSSQDDGHTWTKPASITAQVKDPRWNLFFNGPGAGIAMKNGTLVFAAQYWDQSGRPGIPHSTIIFSYDHGKTWRAGKAMRAQTNEAQVIETTQGNLMLTMRDNRGGFRTVATSSDMGESWIEHSSSHRQFEDPICMASLYKSTFRLGKRERELVFFSNVKSKTTRENMTIQGSLDLGETWKPEHQLLIDDRISFGYSCLGKVNDHTLGLLYEGMGDLYFVRIPIAEIFKP